MKTPGIPDVRRFLWAQLNLTDFIILDALGQAGEVGLRSSQLQLYTRRPLSCIHGSTRKMIDLGYCIAQKKPEAGRNPAGNENYYYLTQDGLQLWRGKAVLQDKGPTSLTDDALLSVLDECSRELIARGKSREAIEVLAIATGK